MHGIPLGQAWEVGLCMCFTTTINEKIQRAISICCSELMLTNIIA